MLNLYEVYEIKVIRFGYRTLSPTAKGEFITRNNPVDKFLSKIVIPAQAGIFSADYNY
jgi:hypothetical protein